MLIKPPILSYVSFVLAFIGCMSLLTACKVDQDDNGLSYNKHIEDLKTKIMREGDIKAYNELCDIHLNRDQEGILFWSFVMADKYHYPDAYFDVFKCLKRLKNIGPVHSDKDDILSEKLATEYLKIAKDSNVVSQEFFDKHNR